MHLHEYIPVFKYLIGWRMPFPGYLIFMILLFLKCPQNYSQSNGA